MLGRLVGDVFAKNPEELQVTSASAGWLALSSALPYGNLGTRCSNTAA
jgi:hypothetical protein